MDDYGRNLPVDSDDFDLDLEVDGTIADLASEYASRPDTSAEYLKARWIAQTIAMLRNYRIHAGLSQKDIAEALDTKQPAIARLERGEDITLGRIWGYLSALGKAPLQLHAVDFDHLRNFVVQFPDRPTTLSSVLVHATISRTLRDNNQASPDQPVGFVSGVGSNALASSMAPGVPSWLEFRNRNSAVIEPSKTAPIADRRTLNAPNAHGLTGRQTLEAGSSNAASTLTKTDLVA